MMDVSARITLFIHVWHSNYAKSAGRLSYNNIFEYTYWHMNSVKMKDVSTIIICFIYFWASEFYEHEGRLSKHHTFLYTSGSEQFWDCGLSVSVS